MFMLYDTRNDATSSIKSLFEVDLIKNSRYQFLPNLVLKVTFAYIINSWKFLTR